MPQKELENLLKMFEDGSGFGDPDARRNAEQKLQYLLAKEQRKTSKLNVGDSLSNKGSFTQRFLSRL